MNKEDLRQSIFLIGPTCVGKSLLSKELGKRLNMPVVSLDDLVLFIEYEIKGILTTSKKSQKEFVKYCLNTIKKDKVLKHNLKNDELADKQIKIINEFVDDYNGYVEMFKSLKPFHDLIKNFLFTLNWCGEDEEYIVIYSAVTTLLIKKVLSKLKGPIIVDAPAMFGWKLDSKKINREYGDYLQNNGFSVTLKELNNMQVEMLQKSNTVLLEPGLDYPLRNVAKNSKVNKILLSGMDNYYKFADVSITTNGMFNHPENKYFKKRSFFDAKEYDVKEKLKNNGNIANICDEIIAMLNDLNQGMQI